MVEKNFGTRRRFFFVQYAKKNSSKTPQTKNVISQKYLSTYIYTLQNKLDSSTRGAF